MKTKTNINQITRTGLASLAVLLASAAYPVMASQAPDADSDRKSKAAARLEVNAAMDRLEAFNIAVEKSVAYRVPAVNADIEAYEAQVAGERIDHLNLTVQESIRYQAPMINAEAEAYEVALAKERLENMYLAVEQKVQFSAPDQMLQDRLEYVSNRDYTIPLAVAELGLVSAR